MPIDNDYFKNRQQQNKNSGGGSNNGGGGNYQPPFEPPEMFKNFGKKIRNLLCSNYCNCYIILDKTFFLTIESGNVGIKQTLGKYDEEPLRPGFHIIIPGYQKVVIVDTKVRLMNYASVETSGGFDQSIRSNPAITILDARGLPVSIELTVQYRLTADGAPTTIAKWGGPSWEDKIINPVVRDIVRNVVGNYTAEELPTKRNEIAVKIQDGIQKDIDSLEDKPVILQSVQLREIVLPQKIKDQIERVQIANQESERVRYEVLRTKQEAEKKSCKSYW